MVWVGRALIDHPVPTPCRVQGPLPPDQGAPRPIPALSQLALNTAREEQPQLLWAARARASPPSR